MEILTDIVITASLYLLLLGNAVAVLIGILVLCAPQVLQPLNTASSRWFSSRKMGRSLDTHIDTDQIVLNHPRVLGALLIVASVLVLVKGGVYFVMTPPEVGAQLIADLIPVPRSAQPLWEVVWISSGMVILLGALVGAILGVLILIRIDLLARLNIAASREYSVRIWSKSIEIERTGFDKNVLKYPRVWGAVVAVFALYVLVMLLPFVTSIK